MRLPDWALVWWHRVANRYFDARAVTAGYCNHRPWSPIPGEGGGYAHWRCALARRHVGLHRSANHVWSDDGHTSYMPPPRGQREPSQSWERTMTPTSAQARQARARVAARIRQRKLDREAKS